MILINAHISTPQKASLRDTAYARILRILTEMLHYVDWLNSDIAMKIDVSDRSETLVMFTSRHGLVSNET
jgi:hypothetical protein